MIESSLARVLIVDDEEVNRQLLQTRLKFSGFESVTCAADGREALSMIEQEMPDIILLDVMMPDLNGYEVTRRIRQSYPDQFIPVILVSALQDPENRIEGINAGANDFLSRPFNADELIARINSLLALKGARDALDYERQKMSLLFGVSQALARETDTESLLRQITALTTDLTGANKAILVLINEDGSFRRKYIARRGEEVRGADTIDPRVLTDGLLGWVIRNRSEALLPNVNEDERWSQIPGDDEPDQAAIAVPLIQAGDRVMGALMLVSPQINRFGEKDVDLLAAISTQAAIALDNAMLLDETRRQRARTEALLYHTGDPVMVTDEAGLISRINPAAENLLKVDSSIIGQTIGQAFNIVLEDLLLRAQERQSAVSGEYTWRPANGDAAMTFNVSVSPVEDVGYIMTWQDITAIKENERVRLNSERAEKFALMQTIASYMGPTLTERVLNDPDILDRREKRSAVVLFADLRGFTRLTVEHKPDDVMELLNDVFTEMFNIVYRHDGVLFDIAGDELMVAFNVPYDQEDPEKRAVMTAIDMQRRFFEIQSEWQANGMDIGMGIGINRGPVVLGNVGGAGRLNYAMVGEAVNIAHRLVEIASDHQIVVTPELLRAYLPKDPDIRLTDLGERQVKGKTDALRMVQIELTRAG